MIRIFDIFFSAVAIVILFPFFLFISLILKLTGEGEVFYFQKRVGLNDQDFKLFKFATMLKDSPNMNSGFITVKDDPRILPFGKFLRTTKINELPQIMNVLKGDMSLIGPRPLVRKAYENYPEKLKPFMKKIKPGLSGLASLVLRNEEEILAFSENPNKFHSQILTPFKAELEIWFDGKKSILNYFLLIFITVWLVFFKNSSVLNYFFSLRPKNPEALNEIFKRINEK